METNHPWHNGRPLPPGWAVVGSEGGFHIYAHYTAPARVQWEHEEELRIINEGKGPKKSITEQLLEEDI